MTIYHAVQGKFVPVGVTTFAAAGFRERSDLQQLLKQQIEIIAPDTLIISEEFGDWADSRRRIDLLGIDRQANLVVIELKRTEDGGHMELQALRYAAMVSTLTFDEAVDTYARYLSSIGSDDDARARMLEHLDWEEPQAEQFPKDVRIVLASAEFKNEIATTVLWLNDHGLDVTCIRLRAHDDAGRLLIDVQQFIPLPEAKTYQIRIRDKKVAERAVRTHKRDFTRYDVTAGEEMFTNLSKRRTAYVVIRQLCDQGVDPEEIRKTLSWMSNALYPVEGEHDSAAFNERLAARLKEQGNKPDTSRYFADEDELIHANGKTYAITRMWDLNMTEAVDALIKQFPDARISYKESD